MITVKYYLSADVLSKDTDTTMYMGYELSGHAGFAEAGEDIVCSAVSVLAINTENALDVLTDNKITSTTNDDGYLKVMFDEPLDESGRLLMNAFVLGIDAILDSYGKTYIHIIFEEV
jgi:uncharacterized protein YsxB (DUF464 family)